MNNETMPVRRSMRLQGYDYTQAGAYFITLVTEGRKSQFGVISDGEMRPNGVGQMVLREWQSLPYRIPGLAIDAFIVMPNHVHGVLFLGGGNASQERSHLNTASLGVIVRTLKSTTTARFHQMDHSRLPLWQRNYFEHIVRSQEELENIRRYILTNPLQWELDHENPERVIK